MALAFRDQEELRHSTAFHNFMQQYGRTYNRDSREYLERFALFSKSLREVEAHNDKPKRLWTAGINHLSDRSGAELSGLRGWRGGAPQKSNAPSQRSKSSFLEHATYPSNFSWSGLQALSQVRDQRSCGSCWAVATSTVLQAHSEIHQGDKKRTFSEQDLVACVKNPHECGGQGGCRGATVELALKYVANHGLATEEERPYEGVDAMCTTADSSAGGGNSVLSMQQLQDGDESSDDMSGPGVHQVHRSKPGWTLGLKAWERLPVNNYGALMGALIEHGPIAVSAAADGWPKYESGIFTSDSKTVDHAVTLIGFGEDETGAKYWLIQNSWTNQWGEGGRIRLHRMDTDSKNCGVDTQPELGTGCNGGPKEVTVCGDCGVLYDSVVPHFWSSNNK